MSEPSQQWRAAISGYVAFQQAAGLSTKTIYSRRQHLENLSTFFPHPWTITGSELLQWVGTRNWSTETRRSRRTTFTQFFGWAVLTGLTDNNPAEMLPKVKAHIGLPRPAPQSALDYALRNATPRENLIVRLAAKHGLRREEIAVSHSDDLFEDLLGWSLVVHGKGRKDREVPLKDDLAADLRKLEPGYFFPGRIDGHLSARWVGKLIAKLLPGEYTIHTLRHRFATDAYALDHDLFAVQDLLGHSSPTTTRRYVRIPHDALRKTIDNV